MRKFVIAVMIVAVLVGGASTVWWFNHQPHISATEHPGTPGQSQPATQANSSMPDVQAIQTALSSPDRAVQATVMSPGLAAAYQASGQGMLPPGGTIRLLPESLQVNGNAASVDAVLTANGSSATFALLLVRQEATSPWQVLTTERK